MQRVCRGVLEECTWRSSGAAALTSRRRWTWQLWEPTEDAGGNHATGVHGL